MGEMRARLVPSKVEQVRPSLLRTALALEPQEIPVAAPGGYERSLQRVPARAYRRRPFHLGRALLVRPSELGAIALSGEGSPGHAWDQGQGHFLFLCHACSNLQRACSI